MQPILANTLLENIGTLAGNPLVSAVVTDSRKVCAGCIFVCIKGERVDGHQFAQDALLAGAVGIVAQHPIEGVPAALCCVVPDVLDAYIQMGGNYRAGFQPVLVGITGSVGKTTTKEFCYAAFSAFGNTVKTQGNQNNEIGMPNTLFQLDATTEYAVVEMGMQGMGEIAKLTRAARPQGAIITCIGHAHLEQLGSRENILRAKMEICEGMPEGAPVVVSMQDEYLATAPLRGDLRRVTFGLMSGAEVRAKDIRYGSGHTDFILCDKLYGNYPVCIPALGEHNVLNALSAYALATRLCMDPARTAKALESFVTTGHRQHVVEKNGVVVIEDCYNANPDSMRAGLATLRDYPAKRRVAVLGDMFELGEESRAEHEGIACAVAAANVDFLITVGEAARNTHQRAVSLGVAATHCTDKSDAVALLQNYCKKGDVVLVKASHGMHFEEILTGFYQST